MLVDIGINLMHRRFHADREEVVARARAVGVETLIVTGTSLASSTAAADYVKERQGLFSTAGIHPHDAQNAPADAVAQLRQLAQRQAVVAIGETGLDFNRDFSPRPIQEKRFEHRSKKICKSCSASMPATSTPSTAWRW